MAYVFKVTSLKVQKGCWSSSHHIHISGRKEKEGEGREKGYVQIAQDFGRFPSTPFSTSHPFSLATLGYKGGWDTEASNEHITTVLIPCHFALSLVPAPWDGDISQAPRPPVRGHMAGGG